MCGGTEYNPTEPNTYSLDVLINFIDNKRKRTIGNNKKARFYKLCIQTVQKSSITKKMNFIENKRKSRVLK